MQFRYLKTFLFMLLFAVCSGGFMYMSTWLAKWCGLPISYCHYVPLAVCIIGLLITALVLDLRTSKGSKKE